MPPVRTPIDRESTPWELLTRELTTPPDVLGTYESLAHVLSRFSYALLLDSATAPGEVARYSFLMADPHTVLRARGETVEITDRRAGTCVQRIGRGLDLARELLQREAGDFRQHAVPTELPPFVGGVAGYVGYEYGGVLERLPRPERDDLALPDVVLGVYDWVVAWDHVQSRAWVVGRDRRRIDEIATLLRDLDAAAPPVPGAMPPAMPPEQHTVPSSCPSTFTRQTYEVAVERVRAHIRAGNVFQANLSQRLAAPLHDDPWTVYRRLRAINPAPFSAYFDCGDMTIMSISPERFLHLTPDGILETRPIKGTRRREATKHKDTAVADDLRRSEKDAAEHVMIVDVLRNDLSRVCLPGSVEVTTLMRHERHPTVHHLVSTIHGHVQPGLDAFDALHACFPGGSITGAPKIRSMEVIAELEPVTRGVYCGAIGYVSTTGAMDTSIAIRTTVVRDGVAYYSAGGGIVADSDPAAEYAETLDKARAFLEVVAAPDPGPVMVPELPITPPTAAPPPRRPRARS